jgi:hypothetical protein
MTLTQHSNVRLNGNPQSIHRCQKTVGYRAVMATMLTTTEMAWSR